MPCDAKAAIVKATPPRKSLAVKLVERRFAVYSFDQRGFGRSEGPRMHIERWDDVRGDFTCFLKLVHTLEPGKPVFAYGISFGACQVLDQAIVSPHLLNGVIAAGFSTRPVGVVPPAVLRIITIMGTIFPKKTMPADLNQPAFPGAREKLAGTDLWRDPLCPVTMTMGFTRQLFKRQSELANELQFITIPVLHQQGLEDPIAQPDPSIAKKIGSSDYICKEYANTDHFLLERETRESVLEDICLWLEERSAR